MADPVLAIDRLSKHFGGLCVTDAVSLTVEPGEVHAVIGPNGAGKTTLVAQIAGALAPDSGTIRFGGRDITRLGVVARARLGLARVFQISSVIGAFSARDNLLLALDADRSAFSFARPGADRASRDHADALLADVGLAGRGDVAAGAFSHGERRALELAMALGREPKLLLLDEPMAGTGRDETARLTELLAGLKGRVPMLLVEHDMGTVFALADRITVLVGGAVVASGAPAAIRADPLVRRAYLGEDAA